MQGQAWGWPSQKPEEAAGGSRDMAERGEPLHAGAPSALTEGRPPQIHSPSPQCDYLEQVVKVTRS